MSKNETLIFFVGVNENSTTCLYTFEKGGQENVFLEEEKSFFSSFLKSVQKVEMSTTKHLEFGF